MILTRLHLAKIVSLVPFVLVDHLQKVLVLPGPMTTTMIRALLVLLAQVSGSTVLAVKLRRVHAQEVPMTMIKTPRLHAFFVKQDHSAKEVATRR